jgi:hypothetical protein
MDLNHLVLQKDSFIDDEDRASAVDLLYKTTIRNEKEGISPAVIEKVTHLPLEEILLLQKLCKSKHYA